MWEGRPDAWLGRLLFPLAKGAVRRRALAELRSLKELVETRGAVFGSAEHRGHDHG